MLGSRGSRRIAVAACAALVLTATGCGESGTEESTVTQVRLYGTDGNMSNSFGEEFEGDNAKLIDGMKGTIPLTPLTADFKSRLLSVNPDLTGFLYAAEAYDAVMISALATELAGTTTPSEIAKQINGVTTNGRQCSTATACLKLARTGADLEYRGPSLTRGGFTDIGEPSTASYATQHFDGNRINDGKTEFVGAGNESTASTKKPPKPKKPGDRDDRATGAPLKLGGLLPKTGELAHAHPPLAAGVKLALQEINAAGGILGEPVTWIDGDDGTNPAVAKATVASHVAEGVHALIGAGASGISRAVLPDVVAAGRILFSPSNTDAGLSSVADQGLYFRTAPPDNLQGRALADVILRDGPEKVAIVARRDSYGEGLQGNVNAELERAGLGSDRVKLLTYELPEDPQNPVIDFTEGAQEIKAFGADSVLIVGFGESAQVITALVDAGVQIQS